jgi:hypothetical protein
LAGGEEVKIEPPVSGPSATVLAGHHLTEAVKHLLVAAGFVRSLAREDEAVLVDRLLVASDDVRAVCDLIEEKP